jgi:rare lipoprotein A
MHCPWGYWLMKLFDKTKTWIAGLALAALAGCGGGGELPPASAGGQGPVYGTTVSDFPVLVGEPYTINGRTYTPSDPSHYDEVGLASYYGDELSGRPTANGERFQPSGISAAHRTLPLPSYVEVTALQTGRTILVRINDRGPFTDDRIIDLSIGAARQLGIVEQGTAAVRVRRVQPIDSDRARLRAGQPAEPRLQTSPQLLAALRAQFERGGGVIPPATPSPDAPAPSGRAGVDWEVENEPQAATPPSAPRSAPTATGSYYVQLGAFSNAANAQRLASRAQNLGTVRVVSAGNIRRVRLGPYPSQAAANQAQSRARAAGFGDARVFRDTGR